MTYSPWTYFLLELQTDLKQISQVSKMGHDVYKHKEVSNEAKVGNSQQ